MSREMPFRGMDPCAGEGNLMLDMGMRSHPLYSRNVPGGVPTDLMTLPAGELCHLLPLFIRSSPIPSDLVPLECALRTWSAPDLICSLLVFHPC